jgi:hypothetical protein
MTSFVNIQYANEHPGVSRIEAAIEGALALRKRWSPARATLALLLCAVLAAVLVVGYQVMDSLAEGHLLAWTAGLSARPVTAPTSVCGAWRKATPA